jgi:hypothetical protein
MLRARNAFRLKNPNLRAAAALTLTDAEPSARH